MPVFHSMYLDIFSWSQFEGIEDDEPRDLASSLPGVVISGRAPATAKKNTVEYSHGSCNNTASKMGYSI